MVLMEKEQLEKLIKAGKIASEAKIYAKDIVKPGVTTLYIAESIEKFVRSKGGEPAFPVNVSIDNIAAHSTPESDTNVLIKKEDIVKVDIGVHVDGYIADTAITICNDPKHEKLVNITKEAVENAVKLVKPGIDIRVVSKAIEDTIRSAGFNPIVNLTGHAIERYTIHAGYEIPNVVSSSYELKEGMVIAIEPFATTGSGKVKEIENVYIFSQETEGNARNEYSRKLLKEVEKFNGLPFCQRWTSLSPTQFKIAVKELVQKGVLAHYPVLKEVSPDGLVSQHEHTVIVLDKPIITTL